MIFSHCAFLPDDEVNNVEGDGIVSGDASVHFRSVQNFYIRRLYIRDDD